MSTFNTLRDNALVVHARRILWTFGIGAPLIATNPASAETFAITENQFTSSAAFDTTPTLGSDAFGDMAVYTSQAFGPSGFENGIIYLQPLTASGAAIGVAIQARDGTTGNKLNVLAAPSLYSVQVENGLSRRLSLTSAYMMEKEKTCAHCGLRTLPVRERLFARCR